MKRILILGEDKQKIFAKSFLSILKNSGDSYLFAFDNGFSFQGSENNIDYLIVSTNNCKKIAEYKADIIFILNSQILELDKMNMIGKKSSLIFISPENQVIDEIKKEYHNIIALGAAEKNTISVSSIDENKVILNIQRNIMIDEIIIEPQEIEIEANMQKSDMNAVIAGAICKLIKHKEA